ncbi:hypothetical protein FQZ97_1204750 [compost metagenome]
MAARIQARSAGAAVEYCKAEFGLQALHLCTDGGLGQANLVARCSKGAFTSHCDKGFQFTNHSKKFDAQPKYTLILFSVEVA